MHKVDAFLTIHSLDMQVLKDGSSVIWWENILIMSAVYLRWCGALFEGSR
jgi:hypothetical protein